MTRPVMSFALDHFLILTDEGAPQAELLSQIGLVEGPPNVHPGQGTANRRFFFENAMLELGYVRDRDEALHGSGKRLRVIERAEDARASPFGVIVRALDATSELLFPGWPYFADYLSADTYFLIGENSDILDEPLCVLMPANLPRSPSKPSPTDPFAVVTELRIGVPVNRPSSVLKWIGDIEGIVLTLGVPHHMEVVFNDEQDRLLKDFRPALPLSIRW
jgi:hypothetical protein